MVILTTSLVQCLQARDSAIWAASSTAHHQTDIVRLSGIKVEPDRQQLVLYVPELFSVPFLNNLVVNPAISLLFASVYTYLSYQIKGNYLQHWPCTAGEIANQLEYLDMFTDVMIEVGLPKEKFYQAYAHQPSIAIRMQAEEVFEQTPRKGTGEKIFMV